MHGRVECGAEEEVLVWRDEAGTWEAKGRGRRLLEERLWEEMVSNTERLAADLELLRVDFVVAGQRGERSLLEARVTNTAALLSPKSRKFRPHYQAILRRFRDGHGLYKLSLD